MPERRPQTAVCAAWLLAGAALCGLAASPGSAAQRSERFVVASKNFTESRILGEIIAQLVAAHTELAVEHRANLGGTLVCWEALKAGEVDAYPEYTGTAWAIVLREAGHVSDPLQAFLHVERAFRERWDVAWLAPFGFENSYALAMAEERAAALEVRSISDLVARSPELRAGFSIEYMQREDGWSGLQPFYGLAFDDVRALEHGLAYEALAKGSIDVIDAYTTDAKLLRYDLRLLIDDRGFYPPYDAAPLVRGTVLRAHPSLRALLERLAFRLSDERMIALNHRVEVEGADFALAAREFLVAAGLLDEGAAGSVAGTAARGSRTDLVRLAGEHLLLTFVAVLLAALIAVPLGIAITKHRGAERVALGLASAIQTVPSLALLAFLIAVPFLGLSVRSAVVALMLYAILPILRNTFTGLNAVAPELVDAARGMGLTERQILWRIQLPLATRTIFAGIRTATVISIGVATLAAFIGAGGLGEPIITGLYLNDVGLILSGAIPAALLALLADRSLALLEQRLIPRGLRG